MVFVLDVFVEEPADGSPGEIVERGRGRQLAGAGEDDGGVEVADVRFGPGPGAEVEENRGEGADDPEVHQGGVDLPGGEDAAGADEAPDDGGVEEDTAVGAGEMRDLSRRAHVFDGAEGPFHNGDLDEAGPDGCYGLGGTGEWEVSDDFMPRAET